MVILTETDIMVFSEHELMFTICCRPSFCCLSGMLVHPT